VVSDASERARRLHFVYNVDATPLALALDFLHRLRSPETYPCRLCDVTYGRFVKKSAWRRWVDRLPIAAQFHVRNVFRRRFPEQAREAFPAVYLEEPTGSLRRLIETRELDAVSTLEELEELVAGKLAGLGLEVDPKT
jgi:hypothetical protein